MPLQIDREKELLHYGLQDQITLRNYYHGMTNLHLNSILMQAQIVNL